MTALLKRFLHDQSGAALDQTLLVTGLSLLIIPTARDIGASLAAVFEKLTKALH
jgi:Flp pilus assembly pilin Flp